MFPVKEFMTTNPITVNVDTPIYEAIEALANHKISGLPVIDNYGILAGVLSEFDVLQLLIEEAPAQDATVEDYMTKQAIAFKGEDSALDLCEFFKTSNKRRAPIIDETGKLIGILTRHDIIKLIVSIRKKISQSHNL